MPSPQGTEGNEDLVTWYSSFLPEEVSSGSRILHSYRHVMTGFSAQLTPEHVKEMEAKAGFVSMRPQKMLSLYTTYSHTFLGLRQNSGFWESSNYGDGVIIGVVDTGITPTHVSFSDQGMQKPPSRWKGSCEGGVTCNRKIIGAKSFGLNTTPIDKNGHGTHVSSISAGNYVQNANVFGLANGTAVGVAPRAHVAIYGVCGSGTCNESEVLAAMDAAIEDGVDVISLSLGFDPSSFDVDGIAIGAYAAMRKGIFVSAGTGNSGPDSGTARNDAPWILTVGSSTMDRDFKATIILGNNELFDGKELSYAKKFPSEHIPMIYDGSCEEEPWDNHTDVKGKIVVCIGISSLTDGDSGVVARIVIDDDRNYYNDEQQSLGEALPAIYVNATTGKSILAYFKSTSMPTAKLLFKGSVFGNGKAPMVSGFSSRGPSLRSPGILKPDITGPGESIMAAWHKSIDGKTNKNLAFKFDTGTSMACPHLSGVAALLKHSHPDWSVAAIKSSMMTTAYTSSLNNQPILDHETMHPANLFALGAGHVNPLQANDPGLIYDIHPDEYIPYLCGLNYSNQQVMAIVGRKVDCSSLQWIPEAQLNYPSFSVKLGRGSSKGYTRTVTNVGEPNSIYQFVCEYDSKTVDIRVTPSRLVFTKANQKLKYNVTFSRSSLSRNNKKTYVEVALLWTDGKHRVRSPISIELIN